MIRVATSMLIIAAWMALLVGIMAAGGVILRATELPGPLSTTEATYIILLTLAYAVGGFVVWGLLLAAVHVVDLLTEIRDRL